MRLLGAVVVFGGLLCASLPLGLAALAGFGWLMWKSWPRGPV